MKSLRVLLGFLFATLLAATPKAPPPFVEVNVGFTGVEGYEVRWGDYNNDGQLDILAEGFSGGARFIRVYARSGANFIEDPNDAGLLGFTEGPCIWGDFNNDGSLDFAYGGWSGGGTGNRIIRNDGVGGWTYLAANNLRGMKGADGAWFDYDNDGDLDLLLTGESYDPPTGDYTIIYRNDGGGVFTPAVSLPGTYLGEVSVGDFDRDGDYDIAITGRTVGTRIFRNDGNGVFTDIGAGLPAMINCSIAWGDFDNDGDLDLVLSGEGPFGLQIDIYRNDNGTFVPLNAGLPAMRLGHLTWGDYDNDGFLDLLMVGSDASFNPLAFVYRNNGNGTFSDAGAGLTGVWNQSTADWGDYDNDGKLDIVLAGTPPGGPPSTIKVYQNLSPVANTAPTIPTGPTTTVLGNAVTFHWNPSIDTATPAAALTYNLRVGTSTGGQQIMTPMADLVTGKRRIPARGNAQQNVAWTLKNLPPGTYYWSVQAIDNGYLASGWSAEQSVTIIASPKVNSMSPAPGSTLLSPPTVITATLSAAIDPATVTLSTVRLIRGGSDGVLGNGDDVAVVPAGVSLVGGNQIQIDLTGVAMPNGPYRVLISGTPVADPAPIGLWSLDEAAGPVAADSSGNSNNGTHVNNPTVIAGKLGNALHLDGANQEVVIADADILSPHVGPIGEMSLSAWVRISTLPNIAGPRYAVVAKGDNSDWEYVLYIYGDATVSFAACNADSGAYAEARGGAITTGQWHHLAGTMKKGVTLKIWLDGIPVDNRLTFNPDTFNLNAPLRIGRSGPNPLPFEYLSGDVDDVRLFSSELTAAQVQNLASLGNAVKDTTGNALDGEFSGSFPSGDNAPGGDFSADFTLAVAPLQITAMAPAPGSSLASAPADIVLTLNAGIDPDTVSTATVRLVRAGPDQTLGTGDDVVVTPSSITLLSPNQIRIALAIAMPNDLYQVTVSATTSALSGRTNFWSLDEGIGPTVLDPSGAANGTIIGPVWRPGRVGNALHFNGISDTINIGAPPLAPPWTAGMWVRREDSPSGDARLMDPGSFTGGTLRLESFNNTNRVGVAIYTVADYPSNYTAPLGQWVHLTFVGSGSQTQLFVNGNLNHTFGGVVFSTPRYFIGSHGYNTMLGTIDDVQIFGRNLSAAEIQSLASLGGAVRDLNGNRLDGEFGGTLPSGNNVQGGDFVATFGLNFPPPPVPGAFALVSPANAATGVSASPTYSWNASAGALTYTLQVATDAGFASMVVNQPGLSSTSATPGVPLAGSTVHYWRVTAVNGSGSTLATGAPFSFTTTAAGPGAFTLGAPAVSAVGVGTQPLYSWIASSGASFYTLEVATDLGFTSMVLNQPGITTTSFTPAAALSPSTVYYWRVTAVNGGGSTLAAGSPRSFSTAASSVVVTEIRVGGGCGLTGLEGLLLLLGMRMLRRRPRRA